MKRIVALAGAILLGASGLADAEPVQDTDEFVRMGAYVAASDVGRSAEFYQTILGRPPMMALDGFVAFDVAGGILAVVSKAKYAPGSRPSLAAVPYIQVQDIKSLKERLAHKIEGPLPDIIEEPGIHLLKLSDPEGQTVEFFQLFVE
ncbi:MAG: hypothetical protein AAGC95_16080 [Pseudomonadota bacterium]